MNLDEFLARSKRNIAKREAANKAERELSVTRPIRPPDALDGGDADFGVGQPEVIDATHIHQFLAKPAPGIRLCPCGKTLERVR